MSHTRHLLLEKAFHPVAKLIKGARQGILLLMLAQVSVVVGLQTAILCADLDFK